MNDPIESVPNEITLPKGIVLGKTGTSVLVSLAAYGAVSATKDAVRFSKKILRNRKLKKAADQAEQTPEQ